MCESRRWACGVVLLAVVTSVGCHAFSKTPPPRPVVGVPTELNKVNLPDYRVEPPDILVIEAVRTIPKPPYKAEPLDVLQLQLEVPLPNEPLAGLYTIDAEGKIVLPPAYGKEGKEAVYLDVRGLTLKQIEAALTKHLTEVTGLKSPVVTVALAQSQVAQRISGPHLVRPDGTIGLGTYGSVAVSGLTLAEVRKAIETTLSEYLQDPVVFVDVQAYNSKLYYVVLDGAGAGQSVFRLPATGNETVLDAMAQVAGLTTVSDPDRIWIARPTGPGACGRSLPVDWKGIIECGDTATNYQILPGDRLYVGSSKLVAADVRLARIIAPVERILGITLLGNSTVRSVGQPWDAFGNQGGFGGGFVR